MNEIKYLDLINDIVKHLNEKNPEDNYIFTELYYWYDDVYIGGEVPCAGRNIYGVILKQDQITDETFNNLKKYDCLETREEAAKYMIDNNIIYCYGLNDRNTDALRFSISKFYRYIKSRTHVNSRAKINIDNAMQYFKCIDEELLNNVIFNIKSNNKPSVLAKKSTHY